MARCWWYVEGCSGELKVACSLSGFVYERALWNVSAAGRFKKCLKALDLEIWTSLKLTSFASSLKHGIELTGHGVLTASHMHARGGSMCWRLSRRNVLVLSTASLAQMWLRIPFEHARFVSPFCGVSDMKDFDAVPSSKCARAAGFSTGRSHFARDSPGRRAHRGKVSVLTVFESCSRFGLGRLKCWVLRGIGRFFGVDTSTGAANRMQTSWSLAACKDPQRHSAEGGSSNPSTWSSSGAPTRRV